MVLLLSYAVYVRYSPKVDKQSAYHLAQICHVPRIGGHDGAGTDGKSSIRRVVDHHIVGDLA